MAVTKKLESFIERILEQCEQEGLTIAEVNSLPNWLDWRITKCVVRRNRETKFTIGTKPYEAAMPKKKRDAAAGRTADAGPQSRAGGNR